MSFPYEEVELARLDRLRSHLLGSPCTIRAVSVSDSTPPPPLPSPTTASPHPYHPPQGTGHPLVSGTLLEVRRLWRPSSPSLSSHSLSSSSSLSPSSLPSFQQQRQQKRQSGEERSYDAVGKVAVRQCGPLYGFVRVKDADHRISGWFPLHRIHVKFPSSLAPGPWRAAVQELSSQHVNVFSQEDSVPVQGEMETGDHRQRSKGLGDLTSGGGKRYGDSPTSPSRSQGEGIAPLNGGPPPPPAAAATAAHDRREQRTRLYDEAAADSEESEGPASAVITAPLLSSVYAEVTAGMARTQRAKKPLDYLEERLLRDGKTPTTVRYFVYAGRYVFQPWYFAPYGLFHREYDPLLPLPSPPVGEEAGAVTGAATPGNEQRTEQERVLEQLSSPASAMGGGGRRPNIYIRDAYLCPFSLRIFSSFDQLRYETEQYRSQRLRPPGYEIYRDELRGISCFEVNGSHSVTYCRQLFLLGKSFLENKLAGHDVHSYYFYVVCLHERHVPGYLESLALPTDDGASEKQEGPAMFFAGYFTWEKHVSECNLACIVTLPCFAGSNCSPSSFSTAHSDGTQPQQLPRGIGQFMIAVSYALAYRRRQVGSPERPLSDLGAAAYDRYWRRVLVRWLHQRGPRLLHASGGTGDDAAVPIARGDSTDTPAHRHHSDEDNEVPAPQRQRQRRQQQEGCGRRPVGSGRKGRSKGPRARSSLDVEVISVNSDDEVEAESTRTSSTSSAGPRNDDEDGPSSASSSVSSFTASLVNGDAPSSASASEASGNGNRKGGRKRPPRKQRGPMPAAKTPATERGEGNRGSKVSKMVAFSKGGHREGNEGSDEEEEEVPLILTVKDIASEVGLEEQDVLRTMLGMGLLHRSSEDRSMQLVVPERFIAWQYRKNERLEHSLLHCTFVPSLLVDAKNASKGTGGRQRPQ